MFHQSNTLHKNKVHQILAHSYAVYFVLLLVGVCINVIFRFKIFKDAIGAPVGFVILVLSSILILWAQRTSNAFTKENLNKYSFCHGPYCYTRSPTNWGIFFLILGFGIIANSPFITLSAFVSFVIARGYFLPKEENILEQRYGAPYIEYKKSVKF